MVPVVKVKVILAAGHSPSPCQPCDAVQMPVPVRMMMTLAASATAREIVTVLPSRDHAKPVIDAPVMASLDVAKSELATPRGTWICPVLPNTRNVDRPPADRKSVV